MSHHQMSAFFSGTDIATLKSEGNDRNTFVSLIVNNEGTYCAAVTRKVTVKEEAKLTYSYNLFGEDGAKEEEDLEDREYTEIQYFMLDIEKPVIKNPYSYIDKRFEEIKENKKKQITAPKQQSLWFRDSPVEKPYDWRNSLKEDDKIFSKPVVEKVDDFPEPTERLIHNNVVKLLICSLIVNGDKIDVKAWIMNNMVGLYNKVFGNVNSDKFREYSDFIAEYLIYNYADPALKDINDDELRASIVATAMLDELQGYKASNIYLDAIVNILETFIA